MIYKKLSKCEDISTDLLRFYVNTYLNCSLEESTHLNRTELVVKVKEAELLRRPNRPKFTVVLGLGAGAQFWDLFAKFDDNLTSELNVIMSQNGHDTVEKKLDTSGLDYPTVKYIL